MDQFLVLTSRNLKIYLRDKGAVFFSLLSMIVVICLMVFFLGDMNVENLVDLLSQFPGRDISMDEKNAELLILSWTCAGILSINAVTVTLAVYSVMIKDRTSGKLNSIYTAPIGRAKIAAAYISASWIASLIICTITLCITQIYCVAKGMAALSFGTYVQLIVMIMVNSFIYAALMYLIAMLAKTESAWSALGTVIGTLVGFLGGIYIPIGALSPSIGNIMKCTPIIYGTAMFRNIMTKDIMDATFFSLPDKLTEQYCSVMGIRLELFGKVIDVKEELLILLICGIILLVVDISILKFSRKTDR